MADYAKQLLMARPTRTTTPEGTTTPGTITPEGTTPETLMGTTTPETTLHCPKQLLMARLRSQLLMADPSEACKSITPTSPGEVLERLV